MEDPALTNWRKLIDAIKKAMNSSSSYAVQREELQELAGSLSSEIPQHESQTSYKIRAIIQFASEIERTNDPLHADVAEYLYRYAYNLSELLDINSYGRRVLQLQKALERIHRKGKTREDTPSDRRYKLNTFRKDYSRLLHDKWASEDDHEDDQLVEEQRRELIHMNLKLLEEIIQNRPREATEAAGFPHNILQSHFRGKLEEIESPPEVRDAIKSLDASTLPICKESGLEYNDIFEVLQKIFGFQVDNANNQWEHLVLLLANTHVQVASDQIELSKEGEVCDKIMDNFNHWCRYLRIPNIYERNKDNATKQLLYTALYLLIWGEAANLRFLPECLCYIFYKMAELLENILKNEKREVLTLPIMGNFLDNIQPVYLHLSKNMMETRAKSYSKWSNYDDFNEYFWSPSCLQLKWPWPEVSSSPDSPSDERKHLQVLRKKNSFVEHRTYLHLYHSFHRLWILLILAFQVLVIVAFSNHLSLDRVKLLLSVGPTYFLMMFIKSTLDLYMMLGALAHAQSLAKIRIIFHLLWFGGCSVTVCYLYLLLLLEEGKLLLGTSVRNLYIVLLVIYIVCHILANILLKVSAFRFWMRTCDHWGFARFIKWLHKEHYYIGRRLYEATFSYIKYALFWMVVLSFKFSFSYFFQIKPLVESSINIAHYKGFTYLWHDFVSKGNHNALTILTLWAPIILIYLVDIQIWYTLVASILGGFIGGKRRLGEIHSIDMLRRHFHEYPAALMRNMVPQDRQISFSIDGQASVNEKAFPSYWNEIINCLREEDYINNSEKELLSMPEAARDLNLHNHQKYFYKWPLFLLVGKVDQAVTVMKDQEGSPEEKWKRIEKDIYMGSAVVEAYVTFTDILLQFLIDQRLKDNELRNVEEYVNNFNFEEFRKVIENVSELLESLLKLMKNKELYATQRFTSKFLIHDKQQLEAAERSISKFFDILERSFKTCPEKIQTTSRAVQWPTEAHKCRSKIRRLQHLLKGDGSESIPKNPEARRRLQFFANSLFMKMPKAKSVETMRSFSVITPFSSGDVIYTIEQLNKKEDGISLLFYLQKVFPDDWKNFLEKLKIKEDILMMRVNEDLQIALKLRLWASYRGQTLARTVRGMMYYHKALQVQRLVESSEDMPHKSDQYRRSQRDQVHANLKFTYIVTCEISTQQEQEKQQKRDILYLLKNNKALRVAYIHMSDQKEYFSKLIKADVNGIEQEIYKIKLPGDPWLGERKSENQNHAIIFTRGDALQSTAADQDNYFEEVLKMRNLLEEFSRKKGLRPPSILGVRAHVFTGSVSSIAWFMSNQEECWATLGQRVLANPLRVRMHYGDGDIVDRIFHITRGGISKASRGINASEDIFAGYNSILRNGSITHREYIQVGKGCSVGLNQIAMFQGRVACGSGEQSLSRDMYRLGQLFDFFRMMSFYISSIGFYVCCMMMVLTVYFFLYGRAYLAFSGIGSYLKNDTASPATDTALATEFLFQIGAIAIIPIVTVHILEEDVFKALVKFVTMQLQLYSVFYAFLLGTCTHYFARAILHGVSKDRETGRGFVIQHTRFAENYRLYSRSHFVKGLEILMLLLVNIIYGFEKRRSSYIILSLASWFLAVSWLFAPFLFNPAGFEWQKTVEDFADWTNWILYKSGRGLDVRESWETWWNNEQEHVQSCSGRIVESILCLRFFFFQYGVVYQLHVVNGNTSLLVYAYSWLIFFIILIISKVFTVSQKMSFNVQLFLRLVQGIVSMLLVLTIIILVIFTSVSIGDIFALLLAFIPTGWAIISIAIVWKPLMKKLGVWRHVRKLANFYDGVMGMLLFIPLVLLSWFPFVSTFQTRIVFNQAFSRGMEISLILGGEQVAPPPPRTPRTPTSSASLIKFSSFYRSSNHYKLC